jgi:Nucleotide-sugar transporter
MVALVVKKFDNIVKLYTQALANMFTAVACWFLFSDYFQLTALFGLCLLLVFCAILMYELKHIDAFVTLQKKYLCN